MDERNIPEHWPDERKDALRNAPHATIATTTNLGALPVHGPEKVETKCHMIETRHVGSQPRYLVATRGVDELRGRTQTLGGIEVATRKFLCRKCKQVLSFDSARLTSAPDDSDDSGDGAQAVGQ